jgi:hypothetical protein
MGQHQHRPRSRRLSSLLFGVIFFAAAGTAVSIAAQQRKPSGPPPPPSPNELIGPNAQKMRPIAVDYEMAPTGVGYVRTVDIMALLGKTPSDYIEVFGTKEGTTVIGWLYQGLDTVRPQTSYDEAKAAQAKNAFIPPSSNVPVNTQEPQPQSTVVTVKPS